ncbi:MULTISPECIES: hypothetical protein [unclassified Labrenzia]|uniref:hypothetical protein n=1 Tax=unclassified Labrenzia TaxID=2648686 RepID=UPI0012694C62|nr:MULTISPECIES: hypothetical protein [unclassified Labrenzia]
MKVPARREGEPNDIDARRSALLKKMSSEHLSHEQGEALALELGIGPLQTYPDPDTFNPFSEVSWSIDMVLAWVMFRDVKFVKRFWDRYCQATIKLKPRLEDLQPGDDLVYRLEPDEPLEPSKLTVLTKDFLTRLRKPGANGLALISDVFLPYDEAARLLAQACVSKGLTAVGEHTSTKTIQTIPREIWLAAELRVFENVLYGAGRFNLVTGPGNNGYVNIKLPSAEVVKMWPETERFAAERARIIDQINRGNMTPEQGKIEAQKKGLTLSPLNPHPSTFAPLSEPTWTLPMVLAWIMFRTPEDVTQHCEKYTRRCFEWRSEGGGYYLAHLRDPSTARMAIKEARSPTSEETINSAKDKLKAALLSGELTAFGQATGQKAVVPIPKLKWGGLDFLYDKNWRDVAGNMQSRERYENLSFEAAKVQALWPVQDQETKPETFDEVGPTKKAHNESVSGRGKRGRKPTSYDGFIEEHAEVFSKYGAYGENHPLFASPGDVKAALERWFEKKNKDTGKPEPQKSSLYRYVNVLRERFK